MSAVFAQKKTSSRVLHHDRRDENEREPRLCWRELVQLATGGFFSGEQRLEHLFDRIERLP